MSHDWNADIVVSVEEMLLVRAHLNDVRNAVDVLDTLHAWDAL